MLLLIVSLVWKIALSLFFIDLLVVNFLLYRLSTAPKPTITYNCPASCPAASPPAVAPIPTITAPVSIKLPTKSRHISYFPLLNSGSVLSYDWVDLPGTDFYFDTGDFPGLKEIYFEANMRLQNGNGQAFLRLYDVTNKALLWGSEVQTASQQGAIVLSKSFAPGPGRNLLRVQAKSLTADTAVYTSGRLKIVSEY